jgi:hypothetical protein
MAGLRSLLLVNVLPPDEGEDAGDTPVPAALNTMSMGSVRDIERLLSGFNTMADGEPTTRNVLYGPGITVQLPMADRDDSVMQLLVSIVEDDIAWPTLIRICQASGWKMMDPKTGRTFG